MPSFAIKTIEDKRVVKFFDKADKKLRATDYIKSPFKGAIHYYDDGLYAIDIEPVYPRLIPNIGAMSLLIGSLILFYYGYIGLATTTISLSFGILFFWNIFWHPMIYQIVLTIQLWRLTKEFRLLRRADKQLLQRLAYGEV